MEPYLFLFFFILFLNLFNNDQWRIFSRAKLILRNYFSEHDSPFNIAIFRIIFFLFILLFFNKEKIVWFSELPSNLIFPPLGMNYILSVVPITPDLVQKVMVVFTGACFLAMIGCFTRAASLLAGISGIYVLGIPEFYGQVDCPNHFIWFMFLLSASRCSDVLSVDSIRKAFREADQGHEPKIQNSVEYALPLRFIWLLMGIIYFFPGFWKFFRLQWDWAFSENFKYLLYGEWFDRSGWLPFFRIDQHPSLYKMCALGALVFELSFIFLILFPALRLIGAVAGMVFHTMTKLFMNINFIELEVCYLSFVNWAGLFAKIGKTISKEPRYMHYDGRCKVGRRRAAVWSKFDVFQHTIYVNTPTQTDSTTTAPVQTLPLKTHFPDQQALRFLGISLLLINSFFGLGEKMSGWPFTCYPTFARRLPEPIADTIVPYGVIQNKEEIISLDIVKQQLSFSRFAGLIRNIIRIKDENQRKSRLKALVSVMRREGVDLKNYSKIRFYQNAYSTQPEKANGPPLSRGLLEEIDL